jgi:predicted nucleic acid-binding protein
MLDGLGAERSNVGNTLILLDTNVLVHAVYKGATFHVPAAELLARGLRDKGIYCIAPQNVVEFAAVVTRPRFVDPVLPPEEVERICELLYRSRRLSKIYPLRGTVARTIREGARLGISGTAWYDLYLAVTMRDSGIDSIVTEDASHFRKFPFISTRRIADFGKRLPG